MQESIKQELEAAAKSGLSSLAKYLENYIPDGIEPLKLITEVIRNNKLISRDQLYSNKPESSDYRDGIEKLCEFFNKHSDSPEMDDSLSLLSITDDMVAVVSEIDLQHDIILARSIFDAEIKRLTNIDKLFLQANYDNFEIPFLSVLAYDPNHFKQCLSGVDIVTRLVLAKKCFLLLRFPVLNWPGQFFNQPIIGLCHILECFTPIERSKLLDNSHHALLVFNNPELYDMDLTDINLLQSIARFKQLIDECGPYYKPGLHSFLSSFPNSLAREILCLADSSEYLSLFFTFINTIEFNEQEMNALVACLTRQLETHQFNILVKILEIILQKKPDLYQKTLNAIMSNPVAFANLSKHDLLEITSNGSTISRFACLSKDGFEYYANQDAKVTFNQTPLERPVTILGNSLQQITSGWRFVKCLHRTLLYVDPNDPNKMRAVKLCKDNESVYALTKEAQMLEYMREKQTSYGLQSKFPTPIGVYIISDLADELRPEIINPTADGKYACYVYDASPAQFKYIIDPDLSEIEFSNALKASVNDLIKMFLKDKVAMHQLIDLFHNNDTERPDRGLYDPIIELISGIPQGKLLAWMQNCLYPNLRANGLADFGDYMAIKLLSEIYHYLPNYLFSLELIICFRARQQYDQATSSDQKSAIWRHAARTILGIYDYTMEQLGLNVLGISVTNFVNLERLERQLQYWLTTEYVEDFNQGKFRSWIHDDVDVLVCSGSNTSPTEDNTPTWNPLVGFTSYRNATSLQQDVGPFAGPFPITELTKLRVSTIMFTANNFGRESQLDATNKRDFKLMLASSKLLL